MMNFLKNHLCRINTRKSYIFISILMTMISIIFAVYLTSNGQTKINVAVVTNSRISSFQSKYANITLMSSKPKKYQLVLNKYDGIIIDKGNGKYDVDTIKSNKFRRMIKLLISDPRDFNTSNKDTRGVGTNIIGYLLMFILLQCVLFMFTLGEDMELKQIERIAIAPVSFLKYLFSHFIFNFSFIFLPAFFILFVIKDVLKYKLGFSMIEYAVLLGIMVSFGIAFAMFINAIIKVADTANMIGASITIIATILSGSFYSFGNGNNVIEKAIFILPQKDFLSFTQGLESGKPFCEILPQILYIIVITIILFVISIIKIKRDYILREN